MRKTIPFSPPDITQKEIDAVCDTLKSGWITTGPKTKLFESKIASYSGAKRAICLSSATAGLELILRMFDIGEGDEVITTPFTYCATANVIIHTGATPVFVDIGKDSFNIDYSAIERKITEKTKAIITVDYGGFPCDYEEIKTVLKSERKFTPKKNTLQEKIERPLLIDDAAHSLGSSYKGLK
nr:DegT/DnrJ/EryC1/StrS aminotransferase family protein [Spirochaetota bacterium]